MKELSNIDFQSTLSKKAHTETVHFSCQSQALEGEELPESNSVPLCMQN